MESTNANSRESPNFFNKLWRKLKDIFANELLKHLIVMPVVAGIFFFITKIAKFSNLSGKTGFDFFTDTESNITFSLVHSLILASIIVVFFVYINWNLKQTFRAFKTNAKGFEYFESRMKGEEGEKVSDIDVTYFKDEIGEREEEKNYFDAQNRRIREDKNFKVRRIILIKNNNDYLKMEELIKEVGNRENFALGCYVLQPKEKGEINKKEGEFIDYLHFNFMVMSGKGNKELCLNNGNKDVVDPYGYMVRIRNTKLAEAFIYHFNYLFLKSYKIKEFTLISIDEDVKRRIHEDCIKKGIIKNET